MDQLVDNSLVSPNFSTTMCLLFPLTLSSMLMAEAMPTMPTPTTVTLFWQPIGCSFITWLISFSLVDICSWEKATGGQRGGPPIHSHWESQKKCTYWGSKTAWKRGEGKQKKGDRWDNRCVWGCKCMGRVGFQKRIGKVCVTFLASENE